MSETTISVPPFDGEAPINYRDFREATALALASEDIDESTIETILHTVDDAVVNNETELAWPDNPSQNQNPDEWSKRIPEQDAAEIELREIIIASVEEMDEQELDPRDWEVYTDSGELWANIWFTDNKDGSLAARKATAMRIVRKELQKRSTRLPSVVNANFQTDTSEDGIACWWNF